MISREECSFNLQASFPPILEITPVNPELPRFVRGLRACTDSAAFGNGSRAAPLPTLEKRPEIPAPRKGGGRSVIKVIRQISGRHEYKKTRTKHIHSISISHPGLTEPYGLEEFVASIVSASEKFQPFSNQAGTFLVDTWNSLQEDPKSVPVLWKQDPLETADEGVHHAKDDSFKLFPKNAQWQCLSNGLDKLKELRALVDFFVMEEVWTRPLFQFLEYLFDLHTKYGSEDDCIELLNLVVGKWGSWFLDDKGLRKIRNDNPLVLLKIEWVGLFRRCWTSIKIFQMPVDFWISPWWEMCIEGEAGERLIETLLYVPADRHVLTKPMEAECGAALVDWVRLISSHIFKGEEGPHWVAVAMELARCSGNPDFQEVLRDIFHNLSSDYSVGFGAEVNAIKDLIRNHGGDFARLDLALQIQTHRMAREAQESLVPWLTVAELHKRLLRWNIPDRRHRIQFMCCCLRFLLIDGATKFDSLKEEAMPALLSVLDESLSAAEIRLLCASIPFIPDESFRCRTVLKLSELVNSNNHQLMLVLAENPSIRDWLRFYFHAFGVECNCLLPIAFDSFGKKFKAFSLASADVGYLVATLSPRGESMHFQMPQEFFEIRGRLIESLPTAGIPASSDLWLHVLKIWLASMAGKGKINEIGGTSAFLALVHQLGQQLKADFASGGDSERIGERINSIFGEIISHEWPKDVLVADIALVILLPLVSTWLGVTRDGDQSRFNVGAVVNKFLMRCQSEPEFQVAAKPMSGRNLNQQFDNLCQVLAVADCLILVIGSSVTGNLCKRFIASLGLTHLRLELAYEAIAKAAIRHHLGGRNDEAGINDMFLRFASVGFDGVDVSPEVIRSLHLALLRYSKD